MKYIEIKFEGEFLLIELDEKGYAKRQINICEGRCEISCIDDCLAEGHVIIEDLDGDVTIINKAEFNEKWTKVLNARKSLRWKEQVENNRVGSTLVMKVKRGTYEGWILEKGDILGVYNTEKPVDLGKSCRCTIIGYDNINMWLKLSIDF